jgi:hypothetical protein
MILNRIWMWDFRLFVCIEKIPCTRGRRNRNGPDDDDDDDDVSFIETANDNHNCCRMKYIIDVCRLLSSSVVCKCGGRSYAKLLDNRVRTTYTRVFLQILCICMYVRWSYIICSHRASVQALYVVQVHYYLFYYLYCVSKTGAENSLPNRNQNDHRLHMNGLYTEFATS